MKKKNDDFVEGINVFRVEYELQPNKIDSTTPTSIGSCYMVCSFEEIEEMLFYFLDEENIECLITKVKPLSNNTSVYVNKDSLV
jgi:hypothetical protein